MSKGDGILLTCSFCLRDYPHREARRIGDGSVIQCYRCARKQQSERRLVVGSRQEAIRRATPKWANQEKILRIYHQAKYLSKKTGIQHHVDHIVPIKGENVCGLHWEGNLQILDWRNNMAKGNRLTWERKTPQPRLKAKQIAELERKSRAFYENHVSPKWYVIHSKPRKPVDEQAVQEFLSKGVE